MILWITGIALYMYGYVRREATDTERNVILLFSFLLIAWAVLTYLAASGFYLDLIDWSKNPGVRTLTIWDHMEYWTWELKAILWIGTGLLLIVSSLVKMHAAHFCRKRLRKLQARAKENEKATKREFQKVQEAFMRSMSKNQSINSDLDIDLEDAFSLSSEIERATILLNRLIITDIDLKSE